MKVLFHICCSNCALYPYRILKSEGHSFTGLWFNPNIHPFDEYMLRLDALKKLSDDWKMEVLITGEYDPEEYFSRFRTFKKSEGPYPETGPVSSEEAVPGDRDLPWPEASETGTHKKAVFIPTRPGRCRTCYQLRLEKTAMEARARGFDAFSTTLLISPYQDFGQLVSVGEDLAEKYNVAFYGEDFRPYFRAAMDLAKELGLYRQKYCGCVFSRIEKLRRKVDSSQ